LNRSLRRSPISGAKATPQDSGFTVPTVSTIIKRREIIETLEEKAIASLFCSLEGNVGRGDEADHGGEESFLWE
jgi:hypothetical protein